MDAHTLVPRGEASFDLFPYVPSATAAYTFLVLFAIAAVVHFILMIIFRSWFFIPFILGCVGEAGGYYGRAWAHENIRQGTPFLVQMMLILGSAPLLAATIYMTLGRLVRGLDAEKYSLIRSTWISKIYIIIDMASFVCQMFGSAAQASGPEGAKEGMKIVMIGLGVQLFAFALFLLMAAVLHMRLNRRSTMVSERPYVHWKRHVWTLYATSLLIIVRSAFRLVEFTQGADGSIIKTEALMYTFDASLLFATAVCFMAVHPGMLLRSIRKAEGAAWLSVDDGLVPLNQYGK